MGKNLTDLLVEVLVEQEQDINSNVNEILERFNVLRLVLEDLLTSSQGDDYDKTNDVEQLVSGIDIIVYKPTTFRVKFRNGSSMNLKYDPSKTQLNPTEKEEFKPRDYFRCDVLGKRYNLGNLAEYQQCLDYIAKALATKPIGSGNNQSTKDQNPTDTPDTDTPTDTGDEPDKEPSEDDDEEA